MPEEPLTPLAEGASQMHELYEAYVDAGFSQEQAFALILAVVQISLGNALGEGR